MVFNKIFVYGTLRKGRIQIVMPAVAKEIKTIARGFIKGALYNIGEYPGAIKGRSKVYGEVIEIAAGKEEKILRLIDKYEEFDKNNIKDSLFIRDSVEVYTGNGKQIKAWVYWYNREVENCKLIKDGIYRSRKNNLQ